MDCSQNTFKTTKREKFEHLDKKVRVKKIIQYSR